MSLLYQFLVLLQFSYLKFCTCTDTLTSTHLIKDHDTIISNNTNFKLAFFSPANSTSRYVGILYNTPVQTAIWVANRDKPLNDTFGTVAISEDGNLAVLDGQQQLIWSSNVSNSMANSSAQLLDNGNLVLLDKSGRTLWQSFEHPSDSVLQNMRIAVSNTHATSLITSWKSPSDPSVGIYSGGINPPNIPQLVVWNGSNPHWRSGPWNRQKFIGIHNMHSVYGIGVDLVRGDDGSAYLTFSYANASIRTHFFLDSEGNLSRRDWNYGKEDWEITWTAIKSECDVYGKCGAFGSCDIQDSRLCTCLEGFEPKNIHEWSRKNWTSGCERRTLSQCERNTSTSNQDKNDRFLKLTAVKVPDFPELSHAPESACGSECLNNCSCVAYAYDSGIGCMQWSGNLIDIVKFRGSGGVDLYVRAYFGKKITSDLFSYGRGKNSLEYSHEGSPQEKINQVKLEELPVFRFEKLAEATENFHAAQKLGQGGFGAVYKGKLSDGQEIAVKRLSRSSRQGMEEFMNEVVVISKLQHRNLVRLLGCCVEGEEKMLIYEYMPNRSLDALLFDPLKQQSPDWEKRRNIIEGIGRGLLYLHRDSRLRIIHRDLKASNILLDEELNPKISDFGLARIFGGSQDHANTVRVVGTYGYMAPEYAMEGRFSEKSDVFSFGVLLLEIVSGRRNTSFYHDEHDLSLLGYAWKLWNEDELVKLVDPSISESCSQMDILRYIHVGFLCVQEVARDRPTISTVLSMLSSEIKDLPTPRQPAFTERQTSSETMFLQQSRTRYSINYLSVTTVEGR
ncbi:hypothetical protein RJ640_017574 [Escallonia rubra]|uniref:Receptor-like serine/threonine-protein kinase n=1 Tax=Escallonia rubra TaxID=112253 RepID=A0AA88UM78_9ASTE|nr:hypothetical protein RJ640_017574 [Escallonia rubra]